MGSVKVGHSMQLAYRIDGLQTGNPEELRILGFINASTRSDAAKLEASLHRFLKGRGRHIRGEWFRLTQSEVAAISDHFKEARI